MKTGNPITEREPSTTSHGISEVRDFRRPSCYECNYKSAQHNSDITLGDFWGIESVAPELDDDKGASLLICNTEKGMEFFNAVREQCLWKKVLFAEVLEKNHHLLHSLKHPAVSRDTFFQRR